MGRTPYIGFSNNTLDGQPLVKEGDLVDCPHCHDKHPLECATENGKPTNLLMFYKCGDKSYLGAVAGKSIMAVKNDVSGFI